MTYLIKAMVSLSCLIVLIGFSRCNHPAANHENSILGQYELVGFDSNGNKIVEGTISLQSVNNAFVEGRCRLKKLADGESRFYDKDGLCQGEFDGKNLELDLAPTLDDGGIVMRGTVEKGVFKGQWIFKGFFDSDPYGSFEARKS